MSLFDMSDTIAKKIMLKENQHLSWAQGQDIEKERVDTDSKT